MADRTLTAANSVYMLGATLLYPTPQQLQGYATDAAFETEGVDAAEVVKGVDGFLSAGFMPFITPQTINLQADSRSVDVLENIWNMQVGQREIIYLNATISIPAVEKVYTLSKGVLTNFNSIPSSRKTLQPRVARIMWNAVSPAAV